MTRSDHHGRLHPLSKTRQSSPMACRGWIKSFAPFQRPQCLSNDTIVVSISSSRDNQVWWHAETNHGHPHPFHYPETIKSDGTRRQIMVIHTLFVFWRQSSPMARGEKSWSSAPFSLSRVDQVRWHADTNHGHLHPFRYPEMIKSDGMQRPL